MFLCNKCHALFELPETHEQKNGHEASCTDCKSDDVVKLNVCQRDMGIDESGPPAWEYVCHHCNTFFRAPCPRGPDESKSMKCPECASKDIERFRVCCLEDMEHALG